MTGDEKLCKGCLKTKPKSEFYRHVHTRDGLRPECKTCFIRIGETKRKANIEQHRARRRKYSKRAAVKKRRNIYERLRRLRKRRAARKDGT